MAKNGLLIEGFNQNCMIKVKKLQNSTFLGQKHLFFEPSVIIGEQKHPDNSLMITGVYYVQKTFWLRCLEVTDTFVFWEIKIHNDEEEEKI